MQELMINQQGASEIYLNGRLICRFGVVSSQPETVDGYNPSGEPIAASQLAHVVFDNLEEQVLAVRFAVEPNLPDYPYLTPLNPVLKIQLNQDGRMSRNDSVSLGYVDITPIDYFKGGLFLILSFLHLVFYFSYRKEKANLYFGFFCLLTAVFYPLNASSFHYIHDLSARVHTQLVLSSLFVAYNAVLLIAVFKLLRCRRGLLYWVLMVVGVGLTVTPLLGDLIKTQASLGIIYSLLTNMESTRISLLSAMRGSRSSWTVAWGGVAYVVFVTGYVLNTALNTDPWQRVILEYLFSNLGVLSLPLSITLYLARDFARTSHSLEAKLLEVEQLSAKTVAQEQEKQLMLTQQNETLEQKVTERTAQLQHSLDTLKTTQAQLIQKEKMASLGELTAGIAHEIQNPLNFVNNFAEVSVEMADELQESLQQGDVTNVADLSTELRENMGYIVENGKRAASIVRSMLEHSRSSTGERRPTNLNELADEYLKLAYHGMRAQDPDFQVQLCTQFDGELKPVTIAPQDMGRVLLNLYNNAFYAVRQKQGQQMDYQPQVMVCTQQVNGHVELRVKDNGVGIPDSICDKVFQPFFTTKPTGQGTGLGLSLSYDIVTKGHNGEMTMESQEGQGTTVVVTI
ncbi:hypothetical protein GCM10023187_10600 [Nibrella viscosa]|uniref:histidine kinase n=2 Tax=Nibrella viscosa TaxID=1084524 RepID=A0ABP8K142_9BACT